MRLLIFLLMLVLTRPCVALDAAAVGKLAFGDAEERSAALAALVAEGDPKAVALLEALAAGDVQSAGERVLIVKGEEATDAATGAKVSPLPKDREDVVANNRLRREIESALSALKLLSPDRSARLAAAQALSTGAEDAVLPLVKKAMAQETDPVLKPMLELIAATLELKGGTKESRIAAVRRLSDSNSPNTKTLLMALLEKDKDGKFAESDEDVRAAAQASLRAVEGSWSGARWAACCSPESRSGRSCCSPRSVSRSPTA
jgi:urea transport system permease protein